jgi:hypothetical protein
MTSPLGLFASEVVLLAPVYLPPAIPATALSQAPTLVRRGYPAPLDSRPVLDSNFSVGGTSVRLEHFYDLPAYDRGTRKAQFVVAGDVTYHFSPGAAEWTSSLSS